MIRHKHVTIFSHSSHSSKEAKKLSLEQLTKLPFVRLGSRELLEDGRFRLYYFVNDMGGRTQLCSTDLPISSREWYNGGDVRVVPSKIKEGCYTFQYLQEREGYELDEKYEVSLWKMRNHETGATTWIAGVYEVRDAMQDYPTPAMPLFEYESPHYDIALEAVQEQYRSKAV